MFKYSKDLTINGGMFTAIATSTVQTGIDKLVKAANPYAMHDSSVRYDPPKCHPGTRSAILEHIMQWIFGSSDRDALILWLYGPAGAGKSAILQSIAEKCAELEILLASFLFSRSDETRNHPGSLVATIAYQISTRIPQLTTSLEAAIIRDPRIFDKSLDTQINMLIVGPLQDVIVSGFFANRMSSPRLILIDGLDECNSEIHRSGVLRAIARALRVHNLPVIFLISSRPEPDIKVTFDSAELVNLWGSLVLDHSFMPFDDIRLFLNDSFRVIKATHPLKAHIQPLWPMASAVNTLVTKSSGQFIYASTVVKFISATHASPPKQLDIILGIRPAHSGDLPFAEIDALYKHILSSVRDTQLMLDVFALLMGYLPFDGKNDTSNISQLLGVDEDDVEIVFSSLASITTCLKFTNGNSGVYSLIYISHASLSDFLADRQRSGHFHIDKNTYTGRLVNKGKKWLCLQMGLSKNPHSPLNRSTLDFLDICQEFSTLFPQAQITKDLSLDSSASVDQTWCSMALTQARTGNRWNVLQYFTDIIEKMILLQNKIELSPNNSGANRKIDYQEICSKFARCLEPCLQNELKKIQNMRLFIPFAETLGHTFTLNGTLYTEILTKVVANWEQTGYLNILEYFMKGSIPHIIYKASRLRAIKTDQNPYIHTTMQTLKSLINCPGRKIWDGVVFQGYYWHKNSSIISMTEKIRFQAGRRKISRNRHDDGGMLSGVKSGKISKFRREIRLKNLQPGIRECWCGWKQCIHKLNRNLALKILIPILDLCPKSDKLVAALSHRVRRVSLRYTPQRRLTDAVYKYIRRTSGDGSN